MKKLDICFIHDMVYSIYVYIKNFTLVFFQNLDFIVYNQKSGFSELFREFRFILHL